MYIRRRWCLQRLHTVSPAPGAFLASRSRLPSEFEEEGWARAPPQAWDLLERRIDDPSILGRAKSKAEAQGALTLTNAPRSTAVRRCPHRNPTHSFRTGHGRTGNDHSAPSTATSGSRIATLLRHRGMMYVGSCGWHGELTAQPACSLSRGLHG